MPADLAIPGPLDGSFTATGASDTLLVRGWHNISIVNLTEGGAAFVGTVVLQRQFPGKSDWRTVGTYTAPVELGSFNNERGVRYRFECTAYTSGTIGYRLSY